jgi:hypothetical protein
MPGTATGLLYNPYLGRRYMLVGANGTRTSTFRDTLHELFHSYQSGYSLVDWNSLVPVAEASATLLEREAAAHYKSAAKVTILDAEGNNAWLDQLSQGLDGPLEFTEENAQMFGYGLSWFLEYLRDNRTKGERSQFHKDLLDTWGATRTDSQHATLAWAAAATGQTLGSALDSFALEKVLPGMTRNNAYAKQYFGGDPKAVFHDPFAKLDLSSAAWLSVGAKIPRYSLQYYRVVRPTRKDAQVVLQVPRSWDKTAAGRSVYLGTNAEDAATIRLLPQAEAAPGSSATHASVLVKSDAESYFFVVDRGVSAPWFGAGLGEATLFVLEAPSSVVATKQSGGLLIRWTRPPAAGRASTRGSFFVYAKGIAKRAAEVDDSKTEVFVPAAKLDGATDVDVTWAVEAGTVDGKMVYLESAHPGGGITVTHGPLPSGWKDQTKRASNNWTWENQRRKNGSRLLLELELVQSLSSEGGGGTALKTITANVDVAVLEKPLTAAQIQVQCQAAPTGRDLFWGHCLGGPRAQRMTLGGWPAARMEVTNASQEDYEFAAPVARRTGPGNRAAGAGARGSAHYTTFAVETGGEIAVFVRLHAEGNAMAITGGAVLPSPEEVEAAYQAGYALAQGLKFSR